MSQNRVNVYKNAGFNYKLKENSYSNQQPRMNDWGTATNCATSCCKNKFLLTGIFLNATTGLGWVLSTGQSILSGDPIIVEGVGVGVVISFSANNPLQTLSFSIENECSSLTISNTTIITLPNISGNVNGNTFTTPGGIGIPSAGSQKYSKSSNRAPLIGWRKRLESCYPNTKTLKKTTDIYKDNWSQCKTCPTDKKGNAARTSKPIIQSSRQRITWAQPHNRTAGGYYQYRQNIRCSSYARSMEKFPIMPALTQGAYAAIEAASIKLPKNVYHKSGCYGCCKCCVRTQAVLFLNKVYTAFLGGNITDLSVGLNTFNPSLDNYEIQPGIFMDVFAVWVVNLPAGPFPFNSWSALVWLRVRGEDCVGAALGNPFVNSYITSRKLPNSFVTSQVINLDYSESECQTVDEMRKTIYKRSNKKFAKQGATSSGNRLERLKVDTIQGSRIQKRIVNSNCNQSHCDTDSKNFTQGYRTAKPRFVTNPEEGGDKTAGFPPTRWRKQYISRGKAVGNIINQRDCKNCA